MFLNLCVDVQKIQLEFVIDMYSLILIKIEQFEFRKLINDKSTKVLILLKKLGFTTEL